MLKALSFFLVLLLMSCRSAPPVEAIGTPDGPEAPEDSLVKVLQEDVEVQIWPGKVRNGGLLSIHVSPDDELPGEPVLEYPFQKEAEDEKGKPLPYVSDTVKIPFVKAGSKFHALLPIHYDHIRGKTEVRISWGGRILTAPFEVVDGKYKAEQIKVEPKYVKPPKSVQKRIDRERKQLGAMYRAFDKERVWSGTFAKPVTKDFSSPYGTQRVFNGRKQSIHFGLDLRAPTGTEVQAPAKGRVALAKDLYFTGNTVILDHGGGLFTVYAHLSKLNVKEGVTIDKGTLMGLSGATGRASGPHLHWGAQLHGMKFDPINLIRAEIME